MPLPSTLEELHDLVQRLLRADAYPHATGRFELVETHISLILLTGEFAYKLKKPVNLGFVDFSTADKREHFCHEEVRLNRRLAPEIYLRVVAITDGVRGPEIAGQGPTLWHAVQMRQFARECELDALVPKGTLQRRHVDVLASDMARFHAHCEHAGPESPFGTQEIITRYMLDNFAEAWPCLRGTKRMERLAAVQDWVCEKLASEAETLGERRRGGFIREGHGDLHLGNLLLLDDRVVPFDCLEFNAELRWIDVISDIAFLLMDLDYHGHHDLAAAFLSGYLEHSGDYAGLRLLRLYEVYRAMVRTKVACIRETQEHNAGGSTPEASRQITRHLDMAHAYLRKTRPRLLITCGLSGSGKSTLAADVLGPLGAIRIRSDVERKRIGLIPSDARTRDAIDRGLYAPEVTRRTYAHLMEIAESVLASGWSVIVDAAFLRRSERTDFLNLARRRRAPFVILYCEAPISVLRERVEQRAQRGSDVSDASAAVLEHQSGFAELPESSESAYTIRVETGDMVEVDQVVARIRALL